ncbi:hypothetical protein IHE44_0007056 [Lamprotornis superbus]|uniref:Uncharacterized protein n=1 Tax=Lamprotornis superbus TaxID=245042 RepID=A0A835NNV3_9PASS|nr:hypothetical protein IHE44_0007056 [Lamprotornis superbus]
MWALMNPCSYRLLDGTELGTVSGQEDLGKVWQQLTEGRLTLCCQDSDSHSGRPVLYQMLAQHSYLAQGPGDLEFSKGDVLDILSEGVYLPAEVDVAPGVLIELVAIEQQCQDVNGHRAVGVQVLQILREALHQLWGHRGHSATGNERDAQKPSLAQGTAGLYSKGRDSGQDKHKAPGFPSQGPHLCPAPPAEGQDSGVDFTQRLLVGQVEEVEGVVEPSEGLGGKRTW